MESKGQRSRSQQAVTQKPGEYSMFVTIGANFTKIGHMCPWAWRCY